MDFNPCFRKSPFSQYGGCVEVAPLASGEIAVRDSKNPQREPHVYNAHEWESFLKGVRAGEFDLEKLLGERPVN